METKVAGFRCNRSLPPVTTFLPHLNHTPLVLLPAKEHRSSAGLAQGQSPSPLSFRSQAMRPPPPELWASARRPRSARPKLMEENMKVPTSDELLRCSKTELCALFRQADA